MHPCTLPPEITAQLVARRGRRHVFDHLVPAQTALVVIDMQEMFTRPGAPREVPVAREIVPAINRAADGVRAAGGTVAWVRSHFPRGARDWTSYFDHLNPGAAGDVVRDGLEHDAPLYALSDGLTPGAGDVHADKDRYSAFLPGASDLPDMLRSRGIDTILIAGTLTNVCCESSARDAMMTNFRAVMLADANATRSDAEHMGALVTMALSFGDVQTVDEALGYLAAGAGAPTPG